MIVTRVLLVAILVASGIACSPVPASADPNDPVVEKACLRYGCKIQAELDSQGSDSSKTGADPQTDSRRISKKEAEFNERTRRAQQRFDTEYAAFLKANSARDACISSGGSEACGPAPVPPDPYQLSMGVLNAAGGPPVIQVTPAQAGAVAVARLRIPTVAPGIGPSPDLNRWKIAAVGYPLWLWANGPTHVGPVSDSVAGLSVSLEASVTSLTFRMGDGNTVNCQGDGDEWTEAVEPGTKAPSCGHTYAEPSLPAGNYKVSAVTNWAVTWTANGQSGVINVPAVQTTELPVGELQVLVR